VIGDNPIAKKIRKEEQRQANVEQRVGCDTYLLMQPMMVITLGLLVLIVTSICMSVMSIGDWLTDRGDVYTLQTVGYLIMLAGVFWAFLRISAPQAR